ncbi:hypothetical protein GGR58DRAFT_489917 [Xylaria digitata]|nr:hypothetical protein GGR58DRAFT_489917 [Xylaria digitata]
MPLAMASVQTTPLFNRPQSLPHQETTQKISYRAQWARLCTRDLLAKEINILQNFPRVTPFPFPGKTTWDRDNLPPRFPVRSVPRSGEEDRDYKVCIIGAGIAGLYIALILETLDIPEVSFDFFEASDRIGGRCRTHQFSDTLHDYYDVGAMRFPCIPVMDRTFDLFKRASIEPIPYYYENNTVKCPMLFNNVRVIKAASDPDWTANPFQVEGVPDPYAQRNPAEIMAEIIQEYVDALNENPVQGFKKLMEVDNYSIREYLSQKTIYNDYRGIEYLETFAGSSTSFNSSFSEYVIESIDFAADDWVCIEGGTETLTRQVSALLQTKPRTNHKVTRIRAPTGPNDKHDKIFVEGDEFGGEYDTVFCTTTLGCLQKMDLTEAQLNWGQKCAIRALTYGPSTKIAIKFSRPWWITDCGISQGGVASTDELIRVCVYPSYNLSDDKQAPAVLLCRYCWEQDALRIGSLIRPDSPDGEDELRELVLRGLARLHGIEYGTIASLYMEHHAWNWHQDPNTMGAFAAFGPADFSTLYPYLTRPAGGGLLHFAGEAMSAHHAWIVGALESGYRVVSAFFERFGLEDAKKQLREQFGPPPGEIEDGDEGFEHLQVLLGSLNDGDRERLEKELLQS